MYECVDKCPRGYNTLGNICTQDECSAHEKFNSNSICVDKCDIFVDEAGKKCVESCPNATYVIKGTQKYCTSLSKCTFYRQETINGKEYNVCVDDCVENDISYIDGEN